MRTRLVSVLVSSLLALPLVLAGCGGDDDGDAEPFDTLADCYDDHHNEEGLGVQEAVVVCCVDHPIAGVHPSCGGTTAACESHLASELGDDVSETDATAACATYVQQLD